MNENKSFSWLGADERLVVGEMLRDPDSEHWEKCNESVKQLVYAKAKNIPSDLWEVIIQETMYKVARYLPDFQFRCPFRTWLNLIIKSCIADAYRGRRNERDFTVFLGEPSNESVHEDEISSRSATKSAEEASMIKEDLRNAHGALLEYANIHANSVRNKHIIRMVLFEGRTHAETAEAVGCNPPVVSYVVREAQRYAREKMERKQP